MDGLHGDDDKAMMSPISYGSYRSASRTSPSLRSRTGSSAEIRPFPRRTLGISEEDVSFGRLGEEAPTPKGSQGCVGMLQTVLVVFGVLNTQEPNENVPLRVPQQSPDMVASDREDREEYEKEDDEEEEDEKGLEWRVLGFKDARYP
jgi:hypothetical protein